MKNKLFLGIILAGLVAANNAFGSTGGGSTPEVVAGVPAAINPEIRGDEDNKDAAKECVGRGWKCHGAWRNEAIDRMALSPEKRASWDAFQEEQEQNKGSMMRDRAPISTVADLNAKICHSIWHFPHGDKRDNLSASLKEKYDAASGALEEYRVNLGAGDCPEKREQHKAKWAGRKAKFDEWAVANLDAEQLAQWNAEKASAEASREDHRSKRTAAIPVEEVRTNEALNRLLCQTMRHLDPEKIASSNITDAAVDIPALVAIYTKHTAVFKAHRDAIWTGEPCPEWNGHGGGRGKNKSSKG